MKGILLKQKLLFITAILGSVSCRNGVETYKNLDSEQEHEMLDLDADIDLQTGIRRYDNYQLLRINPTTEEHVNILNFLEKGNIRQLHYTGISYTNIKYYVQHNKRILILK